MEAICPTCESTIDPTRAPVARIRGAKVVTFCSVECAAGTPRGPGPKTAHPEPGRRAAPAASPAPTAVAARAAKPAPASRPEPTSARPEPAPTSVPPEPSRRAAPPEPAPTSAHPEPSRRAAPPEPTRRAAPPEPSRGAPGAREAGPDEWVLEPPRRPDRRKRGIIAVASIVLLAGVAVVAFEAWPRAAVHASEPVAAADRPSPTRSDSTAAAVAEIGDGEAREIDPARLEARAIAQLEELLGSPSPRVQRIAAMALARTKHEASLTALRGMIKSEASPLVVVQIAYALARAGDERGREVLLESLRSKQRDVKLDAARSLVQLGDPAGADQLKGMLSYRHYRVGAAELLARLGHPAGAEALREERNDPRASDEGKLRATVALGMAGDASVRDELVTILEDGRYQVGAALALAVLKDQAAVPSLTNQLDIDAFRVAAAVALRRLGTAVDLEPLAAALHAGNDVLRVTAAESILILTGPVELSERD